MPSESFFLRLGVFVEPAFLDPEECREIARRAEMWAGAPTEVRDGNNSKVDELVRKATRVALPGSLTTLVTDRLEEIRPRIAEHYGLEIRQAQAPWLLAYRAGDFYIPHRDAPPDQEGVTSTDPEVAAVSRRKVTVVIFLNDQSQAEEPGSFGGGALVLYGLINDPRSSGIGFPLSGSAGLLVAFRSETIHEVRPVTHGTRYTVVSWYV